MKEYLDCKSIVKILRKKNDKILEKPSLDLTAESKIDSLSEAMDYFRGVNKALEDKFDSDISKMDYHLLKIELYEEEQELIKKMNKTPEETFQTMDTKFFRDYAFIADAIELIAKKCEIAAKKWAKETYKALKKDGVKLSPTWVKDKVEELNETFAIRVQQKCEQEFAKLKEAQRSPENI